MKLLIAFLVAMLVAAVNAAPGTNATCLQSCPPGGPYNPNCCNCCPGGTCSGNGAEFTTCCTKDQDFCGCISSRAFCSGRTANGANLESPFGTCYTKGTGVCALDSSANVWILCPTGTTGCISSNTVSSCCTSSQTCNTITGLCESSGPATCNGQAYNPATYTCAIDGQGQQVLCPVAAPSACGTACYNPSQYCCQAGGLRPAGQCSGGTSATTQTTQTTQTTATTATTQPPSSSQTGPATCNGQVYDPAAYTCASNGQGQLILCPKGYSACASACYNPAQYCCQSGGLRPAGQCSGGTSATTQTTQTTQTTATTTTQPPTSSQTGPATCNGQVYDPAAYTCASNGQGQSVLCPKGFSACGSACFNPAQYCCQAGGLRPAGQCSGGTSATTQTTQTTQTTATSTTQPPSSSQTGPATCNGQVYDPAAYTCASNGQGQSVLCPKGFSACGSACFNPAQYCCQSGGLRPAGQCSGGTSATTQTTQTTATTTTQPPTSSQTGPATCNGQVYDKTNYDCPTNDQGQQVLCPKGNSACGSACYNPAQYCCQGGLKPVGQCSGGTQTCSSGETYNPATSFCCSSVSDSTHKVCPIGQHCCGNILNGTNYYGPGSLYTACYNPAQFKCCYGGTSAFLNPATIEPISYVIPPNTVRFCIV